MAPDLPISRPRCTLGRPGSTTMRRRPRRSAV
ncbi:Zinc finger, C3HC4 type (RING finger) [Musa troglodytarum]|uniref:Zinc finger, C3HC4 type (RING finger) n=1 Tax=Musa troglodytarum TaxID=320322 RepID=A0A9E7I264_9LILI|nr:Zinc finger, C3HC4 type (RING finger) [Musa troglodytarum]